MVHPRCKHVIKSLKNLTYKEGVDDFLPDKDSGLDHHADGLGYMILSALNLVKPWKVGAGQSRQAQVW